MSLARAKRAFSFGRQSTPYAWESVEKEFDRIYALYQSLVDLANTTAAIVEGDVAAADAEYLLGAAHAGLPNGRVAADTGRIDVNLGTPGAVSWDIVDDSVSDTKLRNSAALSVIGRAANSVGDPADIVAATASTVLRRNAANALEFNKVDLVDMANLAASRLIGRGSAGGAGTPEAISIGDGLVMDTTTLRTEYAYYEPLSDGDLTQPELVFDGNGEVIMIPVSH